MTPLLFYTAFFLMGFSVGSLPDEGVWWASVKVAFALAAFLAIVHVARSRRKNDNDPPV